MSYRGYKGWKPNSRRNRRGRGSQDQLSRPQRSDWSLFLGLGTFMLGVVALLALVVYGMR